MRKIGAVVVAAGRSTRMGGADKIIAPLGDRPVFCHALAVLERANAVSQVVLVTAAGRVDEARALAAPYGFSKLISVCAGGERRRDSVLTGLEQFTHLDIVIVHDGARPFITAAMVDAGIVAAAETGAAVAAVPVSDTLKEADSDGTVLRTVDRSALWAVQTPQIFDFELLLSAHRRWPADVTDDAALVESLGCKVKLFLGSPRNLKITTPDDLVLAEALLACG